MKIVSLNDVLGWIFLVGGSVSIILSIGTSTGNSLIINIAEDLLSVLFIIIGLKLIGTGYEKPQEEDLAKDLTIRFEREE